MLREPQHDDCGVFFGVILSLSKDLGVMQSSLTGKETGKDSSSRLYFLFAQ